MVLYLFHVTPRIEIENNNKRRRIQVLFLVKCVGVCGEGVFSQNHQDFKGINDKLLSSPNFSHHFLPTRL